MAKLAFVASRLGPQRKTVAFHGAGFQQVGPSDLSSGSRALRMAHKISLKYGLVGLMLLRFQRGKRLLQPADRWKHQTRL
jgi:hypothetical protein